MPFLSTRFTVTAGASPVNDFSGVNVTVPSFATSYLPTPLISLTVLPSSNVAGTSSSIGTFSSPAVNVGLAVCVFPWISVDSTGVAVGCTPTTSGVYFVVATFPLTSSTCTVTLVALPTNCFSGVNSITPSFSTYLPSFGITTSLTFSPATFTNVKVDLSSSTLSSPRSKLTVDLSSSSFTSNTTGDF